MRAYAIGDIHGALDKLKAAHALIAADQALHGAAPVVHVGDLVDRGPDSRGVVDFLQAGLQAGRDWVVLKGNHDRLFTGFLRDPAWRDPRLRPEHSWLHPRLGGAATLHSYGLANAGDRPIAPVHAEALNAVPQAHRDFLEALPLMHRIGDLLFVHAGIRPGIAMDRQDENDLLWIRTEFLDDRRDHGCLVVHGHTVLDAPVHYGNRLNIDSGAAYGGPLSAVVIEDRRAFLLAPAGRIPL